MGNTMKLNPNQSWGNFLKAAKYYSSTPAKEDYIARSKLGLSDFEIIMCNGDYKEALKMLLEKIEKAPAADVVERRTGKWEEVEVDYISDMDKPPEAIASMFCPVCKRYANTIYFYGDPKENMNYCPYCGSKNEVGQDEQH